MQTMENKEQPRIIDLAEIYMQAQDTINEANSAVSRSGQIVSLLVKEIRKKAHEVEQLRTEMEDLKKRISQSNGTKK